MSTVMLIVGIGIVGIARFLDRNLTPEWRTQASNFLRTGQVRPSQTRRANVKPWQLAARSLVRFLSTALQARNPRRFLLTSVTVSLFIIGSTFLYHYATDSTPSQTEIANLFSTKRAFWLFLVTPLVATLVIDLISAYQTILFLEMIAKARAFWQVLVLVYGNILISIALFSLLFPLVVVALLIIEDKRVSNGILLFQPTPTIQSDNKKQFAILSTLGRIAYSNYPKNKSQELTLWQIDTQALDKERTVRATFSLSALTSPNFDTVKLLEFTSNALKRMNSDLYVKVLEEKSHPHFMSMAGYEIKLEVSDVFAEIPFSSLYRVAFSDINLFGPRSLQMAQGELVSAESEGMFRDLSSDVKFSDALIDKADFFLVCDEKIERVTGVGLDPAPAIQKCKTWGAVSVSSLRSQLTMLSLQSGSKIFIAPFALSSMSVTLILYLVCFLLLYAAAIHRIAQRLLSLNILQVENIPLTISAAIVLVFFVAPLAFLAYLMADG